MRKITLSSEVIVTDPCYDTETWCQAKLDDVLPGNYIVDCIRHDTGDWGVRNAKLIAVHEKHYEEAKDEIFLNWEIHPKEIGVDSGQAGIFDMKSYRVDGLEMEVPEKTFDGKTFELPIEEKGDEWYNKMCKFTLSENMWGYYDGGVVCRSGYGDGAYTLYVAKDEGKIIAMMIDFHVVEVEYE